MTTHHSWQGKLCRNSWSNSLKRSSLLVIGVNEARSLVLKNLRRTLCKDRWGRPWTSPTLTWWNICWTRSLQLGFLFIQTQTWENYYCTQLSIAIVSTGIRQHNLIYFRSLYFFFKFGSATLLDWIWDVDKLISCSKSFRVVLGQLMNAEEDIGLEDALQHTVELKVMNKPQKRAETKNSHRMKMNDKNYHTYL